MGHVSWKGFQKLVSNPAHFLVQVRVFKNAIDAGTVPRRNIEMARKVQINMGLSFTAERIQLKSLAVAGLCTWINSIIAYYDLVAPKQLESPVRKEVVEPKPVESFCVKVGDIQELKSLGKPPGDVKEVIKAVSFLLGSDEASDWGQCQQLMCNPKKFVETLASLDAQSVSPSALAQARAIAEQPFFNTDTLRNKTAAVVGLAGWVLRVVNLPQKTPMAA